VFSGLGLKRVQEKWYPCKWDKRIRLYHFNTPSYSLLKCKGRTLKIFCLQVWKYQFCIKFLRDCKSFIQNYRWFVYTRFVKRNYFIHYGGIIMVFISIYLYLKNINIHLLCFETLFPYEIMTIFDNLVWK